MPETILTSQNYQKNSLDLLNQYARCIWTALEESLNPLLLNGAALAMRKSIEFMAAYLRYHYHNRRTFPFPSTGNGLINGHDARYEIHAGQIRIDGVDPNAIEQFIGNRNASTGLKGLADMLSSVFHYQPSGMTPEEEKAALAQETSTIMDCIPRYQQLLNAFLLMTCLTPEENSHLARFSEIPAQDLKEKAQTSGSCFILHIREIASGCVWNDFYSQIINACFDATRSKGGIDNPMLYIYTLYAAIRKLAERTGWIVLERSAPDALAKLKEKGSVTLESFLQEDIRNLIGGEFIDEWNDITKYIEWVQSKTNPGMHWYDADRSVSMIDSASGMARDFFSKNGVVSDLLFLSSLFMSRTVQAVTDQPESVRTLLDRGGNDVIELKRKIDELKKQESDRLEKEKRENRSSRILTAVSISAIIAALLFIFVMSFPLPWDPRPRLADAPIYRTQWDEMPEIRVTVGDQTLTEDGVNVVYADGSAVLCIEAHCDGAYSQRYSADKRFARVRGFSINGNGLALFQKRVSGVTWNISAAANTTSDELQPGWHEIAVQAVGAGDGKVVNGVELNAATGWRSYCILVLDCNTKANWTLLNESRNLYALTKNGLNIQEGDNLQVECKTGIREGLVLEYTWNNSDWKAVPENGLTVPALNAGLNILSLRANYVRDEQCALQAAYSENFYCIFEEPETCIVDISLKTEDGVVLRDGSTLINRPGTSYTISAYGKKGISKIEYFSINESGEQSEIKESTQSEFVQTLKGKYGKSYTLYLTAVGVGDTGKYDTLNRKQIAIRFVNFAKEDEYDENDRKIKEWLYEDKTTNQPTGYIAYQYDDEGNIIDKAWYTPDGEPAYSRECGHHRETWTYTSSENESITEEWIYDLDGVTLMEGTNAMGDYANGAAGWIYREIHGENGSESWGTYYGADRKPYLNRRNTASYHVTRNDEYYCTVQYGLNGEPVNNSEGWYRLEKEYENGEEVREAVFDVNGDPCNCTCHGYHEMIWNYDENGKLASKIRYEVEDEAEPGAARGFRKSVWTYDEWGNTTSKIRYAANGDAILTDGYAKWVSTYYPDSDHEKTCEYQDALGNPVLNTRLGYSRVERTYEGDTLLEETYYDENNSLVNAASGYARYTYTKNRLHAIMAYYDAAGNLTIPSDQTWAKWEGDYTNDGQLRESRYYRDETHLTRYQSGSAIAKMTFAYDGSGRETTSMWWNSEDRPAASLNSNYCGTSTLYDPKDPLVSYTLYLGADETPVSNESGFFYAKKTKDAAGRVVIEERFLEDGARPGGDNAQRLEWTYDDEGNTVAVREFTEPLEGVISQTVWTYDSDGKLTSESCYDGLGAVMADEYGVWKYTYSEKEDSENRITVRRMECLNPSGSLVVGPDGYAAVEVRYGWDLAPDYCFFDEYDFNSYRDIENYGEVQEIRFLGTNGREMINSSKGYAVYRRDVSTRQTTEAYYDASGNLLFLEDRGYAKLVRRYDDGGRLIEWAFYGADNQPCLNLYGFARERWEYDSEGRLVSHSFHNADESASLMMNEYGTYALVKYTYDGDWETTAYYDANGELYVNPDMGYSIKKEQYNSSGKLISCSFYDAEECASPVFSGYYGYARMQWTFEENKTVCSYYDEGGKLCAPSSLGYAVKEWVLDADKATCSYYNENGELCEDSNGYAREVYELGEEGNIITIADAGLKFRYNARHSYDAGGNEIPKYRYD